MSQMVFIYELIDPRDNTTRYIGKSKDPQKRFIEHLKCQLHEGQYKNRWIKKLISENFKPILNVIDEVEENTWNFWERWWISLYKSWGQRLTNNSEGGDAPPKPTEESKKKSSLRRKNKTYDEIFGKKAADALKKKLGEIRRGKKQPKSFFDKVVGKVSHRKGKKIGPNYGTSSPVIQFDKQGNFIKEYYSLIEASKETGISWSSISDSCRNVYKNPRKFIFKYKEKETING